MKRTILPALAGCLLATAVPAETKGPFGGFKHDRTCPIEITSDSLEVRQADSIAIFSGQVIAGQCTLRLTADKVEVLFDQENSGNSETGAIRNMLATGNVFISNGSETAQGGRAEYNVDAGRIDMTGNVILTQGENAISGQKLTIDLNSGQGRIEGGRVKSIFSPASQQGSENSSN